MSDICPVCGEKQGLMINYAPNGGVEMMHPECAAKHFQARVAELEIRCEHDDLILAINQKACHAIGKYIGESLDEACARVAKMVVWQMDLAKHLDGQNGYEVATPEEILHDWREARALVVRYHKALIRADNYLYAYGRHMHLCERLIRMGADGFEFDTMQDCSCGLAQAREDVHAAIYPKPSERECPDAGGIHD